MRSEDGVVGFPESVSPAHGSLARDAPGAVAGRGHCLQGAEEAEVAFREQGIGAGLFAGLEARGRRRVEAVGGVPDAPRAPGDALAAGDDPARVRLPPEGGAVDAVSPADRAAARHFAMEVEDGGLGHRRQGREPGAFDEAAGENLVVVGEEPREGAGASGAQPIEFEAEAGKGGGDGIAGFVARPPREGSHAARERADGAGVRSRRRHRRGGNEHGRDGSEYSAREAHQRASSSAMRPSSMRIRRRAAAITLGS